jgi:hypothetical protein
VKLQGRHGAEWAGTATPYYNNSFATSARGRKRETPTWGVETRPVRMRRARALHYFQLAGRRRTATRSIPRSSIMVYAARPLRLNATGACCGASVPMQRPAASAPPKDALALPLPPS